MIDDAMLDRLASILNAQIQEAPWDGMIEIEATDTPTTFSFWVDQKAGTITCHYKRPTEDGLSFHVAFRCDEITFPPLQSGWQPVRFWKHSDAGRIPAMNMLVHNGRVKAVSYSSLYEAGQDFLQIP